MVRPWCITSEITPQILAPTLQLCMDGQDCGPVHDNSCLGVAFENLCYNCTDLELQKLDKGWHFATSKLTGQKGSFFVLPKTFKKLAGDAVECSAALLATEREWHRTLHAFNFETHTCAVVRAPFLRRLLPADPPALEPAKKSRSASACASARICLLFKGVMLLAPPRGKDCSSSAAGAGCCAGLAILLASLRYNWPVVDACSILSNVPSW